LLSGILFHFFVGVVTSFFKLIAQIGYIAIVELNRNFTQAIHHHKQAALLLFNFWEIKFNCTPSPFRKQLT
jgi:hypothetical protein